MTSECQLAHAFPSSIQVELRKSLKGDSRELDFRFFGKVCVHDDTETKSVCVWYRSAEHTSPSFECVSMTKTAADSAHESSILCVRLTVNWADINTWTRRAHFERLNLYIYSETCAKNIQNTEYHADFCSDEKSEVQKQKIQIYVIALRIRSRSNSSRTESRRARSNNNFDEYHWRMRKTKNKKKIQTKNRNFLSHNVAFLFDDYTIHIFLFVLYLPIYF